MQKLKIWLLPLQNNWSNACRQLYIMGTKYSRTEEGCSINTGSHILKRVFQPPTVTWRHRLTQEHCCSCSTLWGPLLESVCKLYQLSIARTMVCNNHKTSVTYNRKYLLLISGVIRKAALMIFTRLIYMGGDREGRSQLAISWPWLSIISHSSLGLPKCVLMDNDRGLRESVQTCWPFGSHAQKWQPSLSLHFSGQNKSQCWFRFKGWGNGLTFIVTWQRAWLQRRVKNWAHHCN